MRFKDRKDVPMVLRGKKCEVKWVVVCVDGHDMVVQMDQLKE